jgi:hypothetical protein
MRRPSRPIAGMPIPVQIDHGLLHMRGHIRHLVGVHPASVRAEPSAAPTVRPNSWWDNTIRLPELMSSSLHNPAAGPPYTGGRSASVDFDDGDPYRARRTGDYPLMEPATSFNCTSQARLPAKRMSHLLASSRSDTNQARTRDSPGRSPATLSPVAPGKALNRHYESLA